MDETQHRQARIAKNNAIGYQSIPVLFTSKNIKTYSKQIRLPPNIILQCNDDIFGYLDFLELVESANELSGQDLIDGLNKVYDVNFDSMSNYQLLAAIDTNGSPLAGFILCKKGDCPPEGDVWNVIRICSDSRISDKILLGALIDSCKKTGEKVCDIHDVIKREASIRAELQSEFADNKLEDEDVKGMMRKPGFDGTFGIIVYVDQHGVCDVIDPKDIDSTLIRVDPDVNVSIMRSGPYGTLSNGSSLDLITASIDAMTDKSKGAIFQRLQTVLRSNKVDPVGTTPYAHKQLEGDLLRTPGWDFTIDGPSYYNTYYSSDTTYNSVTVVYSKGGHYRRGTVLHNSSLKEVIDELTSKGYKNIGIIEHTCHYVGRPDIYQRRAMTGRQAASIQTQLTKQGVMGGKMRITKKRKRRTRKYKSIKY